MPNSTKGGSIKTEFVIFENTIKVQSNKVCDKVSLYETSSGRLVVEPDVVVVVAYVTVTVLAIIIILQQNIFSLNSQSDPLPSTNADFDIFCS